MSSLGGSNSWSTLPDHNRLCLAVHFRTTASQLPLGPCLGCLPCLCLHHCLCEGQGKTLRALIKVPNPWAILREVPNPQLNRWDRGWASMDPYWKTSSSHLCSGQGKNERMFSKLFPNRCVNNKHVTFRLTSCENMTVCPLKQWCCFSAWPCSLTPPQKPTQPSLELMQNEEKWHELMGQSGYKIRCCENKKRYWYTTKSNVVKTTIVVDVVQRPNEVHRAPALNCASSTISIGPRRFFFIKDEILKSKTPRRFLGSKTLFPLLNNITWQR